MTQSDLTPHEQDLLKLIDTNIAEMKECQKEIKKSYDTFLGRFLTAVAIGVTLFLFIMAGSYAFTGKVADDVRAIAEKTSSNESDHELLEREFGLVDGALFIRYPGSAVFGRASDRIIVKRGGQEPPKD